jgi:EmrB/QacA subfamily drug resistance transporter
VTVAGNTSADPQIAPRQRTQQPVRATAALTAALLGFFVITLDATIVNVALPSIRDTLGGQISGLQWIVDGYTVAFAALLLTCGSLADRLGARTAFGAGLVLFTAASLACALVGTLPQLVAARVAQGAGAAMIAPATMALIRHGYPDSAARARAIGIWTMGGAVATLSGPFAGGVLCELSWRWIFLINVPVGALALMLLTKTAASPRHRVPFDWIGQITAMLAMGALTLAFIEAGPRGLSDPLVLTAFVAAAVSAIAFITAQSRVAHPMVPVTLFRTPNVRSAVVIGFAFMVAYYGTPFLYSLYFQQVRGLTPMITGVVFIPMALLGGALNPLSAWMVQRAGLQACVISGLAVMIAGLVALAIVPSSTPTGVLAVLLILVGVGGPSVMPPTMAALLDFVDADHSGTASGVFNTSRQLGGALAIAVFGTLLSTADSFESGLRVSLVIAAVVTAGAVFAAALLHRAPQPQVPDRTTG